MVNDVEAAVAWCTHHLGFKLLSNHVDEAGLDELRLRQRRRHAHDRLVGEEHGALGQGLHVAGEAQLRQMIEEAVSEASALPEPVELLGREAQAFEKIERLLEPDSDEEPALGRKLAHEELEHRGPPLPMIQVSLDHVELVEVGEERARSRVHD